MTLLSRLKLRLLFFVEDTRASLSVETTLIMPLLTWWYVGSFVYFDAFRQQNVNLKAAYSVADMISREKNTLTQGYLDGLNKVFDYLTAADKPTWIRVTTIGWDEDTKKFTLGPSHTTKGKPAHTPVTLNAMADRIPAMLEGDSAFIVETNATYEPFFNVGLGARWFTTFIVTRPRSVPCVSWQGEGC